MDVVFENISSLIVFTFLFLIVYAALLNIYFIHKNGFHTSVNCWFCNKNSKVLYKKRNSFICPYCSQYNGFNKSGDYNRVIDAQHNVSFNSSNLTYIEKTGHLTSKSSNGLCNSCNKNQQLRILQLANYEPLSQKNYEKEIEHFEKQLEKTYTLCKNCSKVVKTTIRKQNAWIFGNRLKNLKSPSKKGLFAFKANKQSQGFIEDTKFYQKFSVVKFILLILSLFNLVVLCGFDTFIPKDLLPEVSLPSNVIFSKIYQDTLRKLKILSLVRHFPKTIQVQDSNILIISIVGFTIELLLTVFERNNTFFGKLSKLLSWLILGLISIVRFKYEFALYTNTLQLFCSLWLVYSYGSSCVSSQGNRPKKFTLKRFRKNYEEFSDNEESSSESLNDSRATYKTAVNKHSPITASSLNNSLNRSFESVRSTKTVPTLNSTFKHNNEYTARNLELNKHFNELNIDAFGTNRPMSCQSYRSPVSPNPFFNQNNRPQSPNVTFTNGMGCNSLGGSFPVQTPQNSLFKLHNSGFGNVVNSSFTDNRLSYLNQSQNFSPRSDKSERMSVQSQPFSTSNIGFSQNQQPSTSFVLQNNKGFDMLSPRDTNSVHSLNVAMTQRPSTYSLRSQGVQDASPFLQNNHQTQVNSSFRPLSPVSTIERPTRNLLSPGKLSHITSFHSEGKENENLLVSFHTGKAHTSGFWSNLNESNLHPRFVVNSVPVVQCTSPLNGSVLGGNTEKTPLGNSRSSSSSSGFISSGDFAKVQTRSLPNSRDHSPDRNSLISEPAFHFKMD